jgi:hypothetical protein
VEFCYTLMWAARSRIGTFSFPVPKHTSTCVFLFIPIHFHGRLGRIHVRVGILFETQTVTWGTQVILYTFPTHLAICYSLHVQFDASHETLFCRPLSQIFICIYKRLISYLPVMFCKFYSNEISHFVCNCCLELRHLARVSLCGPCWRGPRRVTHLQV